MYNEYLEFAKKLALEAGEVMRKYFLITTTEWKSDNTPLTQADTEINELVIRRVIGEFTDHSVLGEEASITKNSRYAWVCDPVDGTMPYSHGLPISTFSLALCEDGTPRVGVVYDPFTKRLYWATAGGGAFCNDRRIRVSAQQVHNALIDLEGVENGEIGVADCNEMHTYLKLKGAQLVSLWSTILPACLVAEGKFSAVVFNISKPEDGAAIKIIVEEAGGKVSDLFGNEQRYDRQTRGFIASNGVFHNELTQRVKELKNEV